MGLEAFLIPLERPAPRVNGLDDVLVSPPDFAEPAAKASVSASPYSTTIGAPASAVVESPSTSPPKVVPPAPVNSPTIAPNVLAASRSIDADRLDGFLAASAFDEPPPASAPASFPRADDSTAFAARAFPSAGGSFGGDSGAGVDPIEDRLAQVAGRLEQAAERLAAAFSANSAGGSRPRTFRGRIDG